MSLNDSLKWRTVPILTWSSLIEPPQKIPVANPVVLGPLGWSKFSTRVQQHNNGAEGRCRLPILHGQVVGAGVRGGLMISRNPVEDSLQRIQKVRDSTVRNSRQQQPLNDAV